MTHEELADNQFISFLDNHNHLSYNDIGKMFGVCGATIHKRAKNLGYKKKKAFHDRPIARHKDLELQKKVKKLIDENPEMSKKDIMQITGLTQYVYQQVLSIIKVKKRPGREVNNTKYRNPELIKLLIENKDNPDISDIRRQAREIPGLSNITATDIRRAAKKSNIEIVPPKVTPKSNNPTGAKRFILSPAEEIAYGCWGADVYIERGELSRKKRP